MARVVVDVMLKPEILDPQGRAVMGALARLGLTDVATVRQGKRFELEIDGELDEDLSERLHELAATLLSNPVIEDYEIYEEGVEVGCDCDDCLCESDSVADAASDTATDATPADIEADIDADLSPEDAALAEAAAVAVVERIRAAQARGEMA